MKHLCTILFFSLIINALQAQAPPIAKKNMSLARTQQPVKIDGVLDDAAWLTAPVATDFIQNAPSPGNPPTYPSEVKVIYDNTAIYIGAMLHDAHPDSILRQMTERDNFGNADWFAIVIDAYRDGNNGVGFAVSASGIQLDTKFSALGGNGGSGGLLSAGDNTWDAVWDSEVNTTEGGWVVEMKIPYSAIRFPNAKDQVWNINFVREIRRIRQTAYWNEVNPNIEGYLNQSGEASGISDIKSPVRLSATPFLAFYAENFHDKNGDPKNAWGRSINGGMDIKYGINDAFTLDMTLIPDFGQVRSDNQVLNLSPFEVQFDENRQFFTEGTELFNKGGLFYSRRVGGTPLHFDDVYGQLGDNEVVEENPTAPQLINATKISGRTNKGLGIGVFNAIAAKENATIRNVETNEKREFETSPLTNYNILVFDQNLKNNSYLTLINTNVLRKGDDYEANVTGTRFLLRNEKQSYAFNGKAVVNQKYYPDSTDLGHSFFGEISKTSGKVQGALGYVQESYDYDPNDLGFLFNPNEKSLYVSASYNKNEQFGKFHEAHLTFDAIYSRLHRPDAFNNYGMGLDGFMVTATRIGFGMFTWMEPVVTYDYFEPRTPDFSRFYRFPTNYNVGGFVSTDYRKKLALDANMNYRVFNEDGRYRLNFELSPRFRASDRLSFFLTVGSYNFKNDVGYVTTLQNGDIIFGIRDNITIENVFNTTYIFSNKMSLSFRLRHYWAKAEYSAFRYLAPDGRLQDTGFNDFSDDSFNAFTVDAVYRWRFAPGSDIYVVWKNNTSQFAYLPDDVQYDYGHGVRRLTDFPQSNSFSVKVIYFLDYLNLKK